MFFCGTSYNFLTDGQTLKTPRIFPLHAVPLVASQLSVAIALCDKPVP